MRKVKAIEKRIQALTAEEFAELREWFFEHDRTVREAAGSSAELEKLVADALAQHDSRQVRKQE